MQIADSGFRKTIEHYLAKVSYEVPPYSDILDVGCGKCSEAEILLDMFEGRLTGIDLKEEDVKEARDRLNNPFNFRFYVGDAKYLNEVVHGIDILIARHPNPGSTWKEIFKKSYDLMNEGGVMIATSWSYTDHLLTRANLLSADCYLEVSEVSPFVELPPNLGSNIFVGEDAFVNVVVKKDRPYFSAVKHKYTELFKTHQALLKIRNDIGM